MRSIATAPPAFDVDDDIRSRLVLGTAQIGLAYGIANRGGRPDRATAYALLDAAWQAGIRTLDTAQSYGDAERIIGGFLAERPDAAFRVVTKLDPSTDPSDGAAVREAIEHSVRRIGRPLAGLLLHEPGHLATWRSGLGETLAAAVRRGHVERLGVSVTRPDQLAEALAIDEIRLIQAPLNAFDHRFVAPGLLDRALEAGREVHLRSILLQGLLTMAPDDLPAAMRFARGPLEAWRGLCARFEIDPAAAAIAFVRDATGGATTRDVRFVIGCDSPDQIADDVESFVRPADGAELLEALRGVARCDEKMISPSLWP